MKISRRRFLTHSGATVVVPALLSVSTPGRAGASAKSDVLTIAQRRLLILGAVIALGETDIAEIQIRAALAKGELTVEQVEEIRVFMVNYVGHPRMASFSAALARALATHQGKSGG